MEYHTTTTPRYNPLEKLPVLLLPDGSSVYESSYILQYLELKHPQTPLLPDDLMASSQHANLRCWAMGFVTL